MYNMRHFHVNHIWRPESGVSWVFVRILITVYKNRTLHVI